MLSSTAPFVWMGAIVFEVGDKGTVVLLLAVVLLLLLVVVVVEKSKGPPSKLTGSGRNLKF